MQDVTAHYEHLLAKHYSWMVGVPFDSKVAEQQALLERLGVGARSGLAVDLGCGPGFQSVALANMGFSPVIAVDTCQALLDELTTHAGDLTIKTACADMRGFTQRVAPGSAAIIVSMGDTLTHLETRADVSTLLADAHAMLAPGGMLVLTFRDLSVELVGLDRFVPVRSDLDRIMTCVLEYEAGSVVVNDLIYVREGGGWTLHKSSYRKLRIAAEEITRELSNLGFAVSSSQVGGGLNAITATRSAA